MCSNKNQHKHNIKVNHYSCLLGKGLEPKIKYLMTTTALLCGKRNIDKLMDIFKAFIHRQHSPLL